MTAETRGSNNNYARAEGQVRTACLPCHARAGNARRHAPDVDVSLGCKVTTERGRELIARRAFADALSCPLACVLQNLGNFLTDRNSSRVLAPPGGASSIVFGA